MSIYFLVAVVVGGAASIVGPAIGAVFYGVFIDVLAPELPERLKPATPVILGVLLIVADARRPRRGRRLVPDDAGQAGRPAQPPAPHRRARRAGGA